MVLDGLKTKAELVSKTFNAIDGISCNTVQGAMYCFPQVSIPPKAVEHAKVRTPNVYYIHILVDDWASKVFVKILLSATLCHPVPPYANMPAIIPNLDDPLIFQFSFIY